MERRCEDYHTFFSGLLKIEPHMTSLKAYGTDGEKPLINALERCTVAQKGHSNYAFQNFKFPIMKFPIMKFPTLKFPTLTFLIIKFLFSNNLILLSFFFHHKNNYYHIYHLCSIF